MKIEYRQYDTNLFHGFYETELSPWEQLDWWVENDREDGGLKENETYELNYEAYKNDIGTEVAHYIMDGADKDIINDYKFKCIESPAYYNFETDQLLIELNINMDKLLAWLNENKEDFNDYLQEHYTSRDGFISYVPNNYDDWLAEIKNDIANNLEFSRDYNVAIDYYLLINTIAEKVLYSDTNRSDFYLRELSRNFADYMVSKVDEAIGCNIETVEENEDDE